MAHQMVNVFYLYVQVEHARFIVEDKKADYVFPVKRKPGKSF